MSTVILLLDHRPRASAPSTSSSPSGLSLIYGLMGVLNFAHGAVPHARRLRRLGGRPPDRLRTPGAAFLLSLLVGARSARPSPPSPSSSSSGRLYKRHIEQVLVTVGLSLATVALFEGIWGTDPIFIQDPTGSARPPNILGAHVPNDRFLSIIAAVLVLLAMVVFLQEHPLRHDHPGRRREPLHGDGPRHRRAPGVHPRVHHRRCRGRPGRRAGLALLRLRLAACWAARC